MDEENTCKADVSKVMRQFLLLRSSSLSEEDIGINKLRNGNDDADGGDLKWMVVCIMKLFLFFFFFFNIIMNSPG